MTRRYALFKVLLMQDFTKHFRGCSDDRLKRFWVGAGQLAAHPVRAEFFGLTVAFCMAVSGCWTYRIS